MLFAYEFSFVDIAAGRQSDGGIFNNSALGTAIENKLLNFSQPKSISGFNENKKIPYTFVADEAFLLKPQKCDLWYSKQI